MSIKSLSNLLAFLLPLLPFIKAQSQEAKTPRKPCYPTERQTRGNSVLILPEVSRELL